MVVVIGLVVVSGGVALLLPLVEARECGDGLVQIASEPGEHAEALLLAHIDADHDVRLLGELAL